MTVAMTTRHGPATGVPDPIEALLREIRDEQARQGAMLAAILQALERGRGARDGADVALFMTIAEVIDELKWTGDQLFAHSQASAALRDALETADITNARELGHLCGRMEGNPRPGLWLDRVRKSRAGWVWRVRVSESQTRAT